MDRTPDYGVATMTEPVTWEVIKVLGPPYYAVRLMMRYSGGASGMDITDPAQLRRLIAKLEAAGEVVFAESEE